MTLKTGLVGAQASGAVYDVLTGYVANGRGEDGIFAARERYEAAKATLKGNLYAVARQMTSKAVFKAACDNAEQVLIRNQKAKSFRAALVSELGKERGPVAAGTWKQYKSDIGLTFEFGTIRQETDCSRAVKQAQKERTKQTGNVKAKQSKRPLMVALEALQKAIALVKDSELEAYAASSIAAVAKDLTAEATALTESNRAPRPQRPIEEGEATEAVQQAA